MTSQLSKMHMKSSKDVPFLTCVVLVLSGDDIEVRRVRLDLLQGTVDVAGPAGVHLHEEVVGGLVTLRRAGLDVE